MDNLHLLALIQSLISFLQVLALFAQYRINKAHGGLGWWALGSLALTLGFVCNYLQDDTSLGRVANVVSIAMFFASMALFYVGVLHFFGQRAPCKRLIALAVLITLIAAYFTFIDDQIAIRRLLISVVIVAMSLVLARSLFVYRTRSIAASVYLLMALSLLNAISYSMRAAEALLFGVPNDGAFSAIATQIGTYLVTMVISILGTFGLIMLVNQRLVAEHREAQEESDLLFKTSPDAILLTRLSDGLLVRSNDSFNALTGFTRTDLTGQSSFSLQLWNDPTERQKVVTALQATGGCENLEFRFQHKDGRPLVGMLSAKRIMLQDVPHILSVTRDITGRKQMEEALRESEVKYRAIIEQAHEGILLTDEQGTIIEWNQTQEAITGLPHAEAVGQPVWEIQARLTLPEQRAKFTSAVLKQNLLAMLANGQPSGFSQSLERAILTYSGEIKHVLHRMFIIKTDSGHRMCGFAEDITERDGSQG